MTEEDLYDRLIVPFHYAPPVSLPVTQFIEFRYHTRRSEESDMVQLWPSLVNQSESVHN